MTSEPGESKYQPNPENVSLAIGLANSIKDNDLAGDIRQRNGDRGIPLPFGSSLCLRQSDPDASALNIRFDSSKDESVGVYNMNPWDYGMGMDTMWFAYETLKVSPEGIVTKTVEGWPNKDDGYRYGMFDRATIPPIQVYDEEESRKIIRELQLIADTGVELLKSGDLLTVKQQDEIRAQEMVERERRRSQRQA